MDADVRRDAAAVITMSYMDLTYPEDRREADMRSGRNLGDVERWASLAAGAGLALFALSRRGTPRWLAVGLGAALIRRGLTGYCEIYNALGLDSSASRDDTRRALGGPAGVNVTECVAIARPIDELYRFWRHLENLPRTMQHLESVERVTDTISHWRAKGPAGVTLEWDAEIINDVPNKVIGWRSLEGADVVSAGSVNFDDEGGGLTRVTVRLQYSPPGGKAGAMLAQLFGRDAATEIREDLRRFRDQAQLSGIT
jgi:uncharacterized membrane protein